MKNMHYKDMSGCKDLTFSQKVIKTVKAIPKGEVLSYGEVAERAGSPKAARAVGFLMSGNCDKNVPCHRVINASGVIGKYNGINGPSKKDLLISEGVKINEYGRAIK